MEEANRTYIGRRVNLYWSVSEPVVVRSRTSSGSLTDQ